MKINVTITDIEKGIAGHGDLCPIARACARAGFKRPSVGGASVIYWREGVAGSLRATLPENAREFISNFDVAGDEFVEPFEFELEAQP